MVLFLATLVLPLLVARCISDMGSEDSADHDVWRRMCVRRTDMSGIEQAIAVLRAIVAEVVNHEQPFSADSYLPAHLIHDARQAIEAHERAYERPLSVVSRRQAECCLNHTWGSCHESDSRSARHHYGIWRRRQNRLRVRADVCAIGNHLREE